MPQQGSLKRPNLALLPIFLALCVFLTACGNRLPGIIIFVSDRDGFEEIYKVNPDGSNLTRVTYSKTPGTIVGAVLSPNGKQIVYTFTNSTGYGEAFYEVYRIDIDGTNWTPLVSGPIRNVRWALDGAGIIYDTVGDRYAGREASVYWADLNGQNVRQLDPQTDKDYLPLQESTVPPRRCSKLAGEQHLSADGKRWVCLDNSGEGWIVVNSDGSSPQKLEAYGSGAKLSPDGAAVVLVNDKAIVVVEVGSSNRRTISKSSENDVSRDKLADWR